MNVFARLRRRKRAIANILLPLLATVWVGASASPCLGMATDLVSGLSADAGPMHDHSETHGHAADGVHNSHALAHEHGGSSQSHGTCPHCPGSLGGSTNSQSTGAHIACSVLDDVSDSAGHTSVQKWDLKYSLPVLQPAFLSIAAPRRGAHDTWQAAPPPSSPIALNLRHCVFLI